jgi:heme-binding protein
MDWRKILRWAAIGISALLILIQLIPYGRDHSDPPVTRAVRWDSPRTEQLADQACGDCHSNLTHWPWYTNVAPVSWLVQNDVDEGRGILNFSEWDKPQPDIGELVEQVQGGEMPPLQYKLIHGGARLSDSEKQELADGLVRTYAQDPPGR